MHLSNISIQETSFPNIQGETLGILRTDSLIKKVILVAKFIIILPWLIIKDSTYCLKKTFKGGVEKFSLLDRVFLASYSKIKKQLTVVKTALAGSFLLGVFYSYPYIRNLLNFGNLPSGNNKFFMVFSSAAVLSFIAWSLKSPNLKHLTEELARVDFFKVKNIEDLDKKYHKAIENNKKAKGIYEAQLENLLPHKAIADKGRKQVNKDNQPKMGIENSNNEKHPGYLYWLQMIKRLIDMEYQLAKLKIEISLKVKTKNIDESYYQQIESFETNLAEMKGFISGKNESFNKISEKYEAWFFKQPRRFRQ